MIRQFISSLCLGMFILLAASPAAAQCVKSNVFLLLDVSGSMQDGVVPSKHTLVRNAIKKFTYDFRNDVRFGLATFGSNYTHKVGISDSAWSTIRSSVDSYPSNEGYTRMGTAIKAAGAYMWGLKQNETGINTKRRYYLVLITDGYPTGETGVSTSTEARTLWQNYGIKTYAIGIKFNATVLNGIATEGQTTKPYNASSTADVNAAFNAIANVASQEICDGVDNDCDGLIDEFLVRPCTTACGVGIETCSAGVWKNCTGGQPAPEKCNDKDDDCDGRIDENWPLKGSTCSSGAGGCQQQGKYVCLVDGSGVQCSVKTGNPEPEKCDNIDNDCDGQVDESLVQACSTACGRGTEICRNGKWEGCSAPQPEPEKCNNKDDDCDGQTDENWPDRNRSCTTGIGECQRSGNWQCKRDGSGIECSTLSGAPQTETCDGKDNDCDGKTDEDWPTLGQGCSSGSGGCQQQGKYVCKADGSGVQCSVKTGNPEPEKCDGIDNDCDGRIDENLEQPCKTICGSGLESCNAGKWEGCTARKPTEETCNGKDDNCDGNIDEKLTRKCTSKCGEGNETCNNGRWQSCDAVQPKDEECNGKDDDCNGRIDDLLPKKCSGSCGTGNATCENGKWGGCTGPQPEPETCDGKDNDCNGKIDDGVERRCKTDCGEGKEVCRQGTWAACDAPLKQPEVCDGKDNSCNGKVDDNAVCPSGMICKEGACRPVCQNGECPKGLKCLENACIGNACAGVQCPSERQCVGGKCVDLCSLVTCDSGLKCSRGKCVRDDCYFTSCPTGEQCIKGQCEADPCGGKTCASGQFCRDGKCVATCAGVKCAADERCVDGKCEVDPTRSGPCASVSCPHEQICEKGRCVSDPCAGVFCAKGRICINGNCDHDPCMNINCPSGQVCKAGQCTTPDPTKPQEKNPNSDGGPSLPDVLDNIDLGPNPRQVDIDNGNGGGTDRSRGGAGLGGCNCSTHSGAPMIPFSLFFLFVFFAWLRKER